MDKKAVEAEVNKLISISMRMDCRQQILLLILLCHRYSYFLSEVIRNGQVEHGEVFFKECFIKPCKLVIGYLRANRKIARKIAKELKGKEYVLAAFMNEHDDDMNVMPMHAVLCLFLALVIISGQSLIKGDWQMLFLYPTVGFGYTIDDYKNKIDDDGQNLMEACLENELDMLEYTVDVVKRKCPVQNRNSLPLTDEFIAELLDDSSFDMERVFGDKNNEDDEYYDADDDPEDIEVVQDK